MTDCVFDAISKNNDSPWYPNRFTIIELDTASCGLKQKTIVFCTGTNDQYDAIKTVARSHTNGALMARELLQTGAGN